MDFEFQKVDSIEKVPQQFRVLYEENEGEFQVGENFKSISEAITGLNKSLKSARADAKKNEPVDFSMLSDFGQTPAEIHESVTNKITELQTELAKGDKAKLNLDKIKQDMNEAHAKELQKRDMRADALQNQLYNVLVENNAVSAVVEAKGVPDLLLPFIKTQVKVKEEDGAFNAYVVDAQGDIRYSGITGQPMSMKDLVLEMKADVKYGRLFESDTLPGGGMNPGSGKKPALSNGAEMTSIQKISAGLNRK